MKERVIQPIPYNSIISKAKIRVNENGQVVIVSGERLVHIKDLNAAIRQQLLYVAGYYENLIFSSPQPLEKKGLLDILRNDLEKIRLSAKSLSEVQTLKKQTLELKRRLGKIRWQLQKEEQEALKVYLAVLSRVELLLEERQRCENIIYLALLSWLLVYNQLIEGRIKEIKWSDFFESVKKIKTIYVNPYRERTQSKEVLFLEYGLYQLAVKEKDLAKAQKKLWEAIKKILPVFPSSLTLIIGGRQWKIENGKVEKAG